MEILSWPEAELPAAIRRGADALGEEAWPGGTAAGSGPRHDPALGPVFLGLVHEGCLLAALTILSKAIDHRGRRYAVSGLSTVVTAASERRRGHGRRLILAARAEMRAAGADLAIFTCDGPLVTFYESGGYEVLPGAVLVGGVPDAPFPSDRFDKVVLWRAFTDHGRVHVADFAGARIELYPGVIDRLW